MDCCSNWYWDYYGVIHIIVFIFIEIDWSNLMSIIFYLFIYMRVFLQMAPLYFLVLYINTCMYKMYFSVILLTELHFYYSLVMSLDYVMDAFIMPFILEVRFRSHSIALAHVQKRCHVFNSFISKQRIPKYATKQDYLFIIMPSIHLHNSNVYEHSFIHFP